MDRFNILFTVKLLPTTCLVTYRSHVFPRLDRQINLLNADKDAAAFKLQHGSLGTVTPTEGMLFKTHSTCYGSVAVQVGGVTMKGPTPYPLHRLSLEKRTAPVTHNAQQHTLSSVVP